MPLQAPRDAVAMRAATGTLLIMTSRSRPFQEVPRKRKLASPKADGGDRLEWVDQRHTKVQCREGRTSVSADVMIAYG